jgi:hypothetical protein
MTTSEQAVREMANISDLNNLDEAPTLVDLARAFAYQGYDPRKFLLMMAKMYTSKVGSGASKNGFQTDLRELAVLFCLRGTRIEKMYGKTSDAGRERINVLRNRYNIIQGTPTNNETVTMARIAGVMPLVIARTIDAMRQDPEMNYKPLGTLQTMPIAFHFTGAPAFFPEDDHKLFNLWVEWSFTFSDQVKKPQSREKIIFYGDIVRRTNIIPKERRAEIMLEFGWAGSYLVDERFNVPTVIPSSAPPDVQSPNSNSNVGRRTRI